VTDSIAGITEVELVPPFDDRVVAHRLQASLQTSTTLRAAVAYWCVGPKELGPDLVPPLSGDGFLCADIHLPTDIDRLCQMVSGGANVYLYLLNPNPQPGELKSRVPPHLLHPKMLLFDFEGAPSELWVGSHNWTARALTGVNIEASLRLRATPSCQVVASAAEFLDDIRLACEPFDPTADDYYKWLQGAELEEAIWVLELRGARAALDSQHKLTVYGRSEDDYRNLKTVDKNIVVSLLDQLTGTEILYEATISDTGRLSGAGVDFDSRLYAAHDGSPRPELKGPAVPPGPVLTTASSWATVSLLDELIGASYEIPPTERWQPAEDDVNGLGLRSDLRKWFPQPDRPLIQRPVPRHVFERREAVSEIDSPRSGWPRVIRRKLVRAKRLSGERFTLAKRHGPKSETRE